VSEQPKPASKLVNTSGKEASLKKTPKKPRKSPKKAKGAITRPKKQAASTPKKQKCNDGIPFTPTVTRVKPFLNPSYSDAGKRVREASMNMQRYGAASQSEPVDLTADSDDDMVIWSAGPNTYPASYEEEI
jgi:hypothetical protein